MVVDVVFCVFSFLCFLPDEDCYSRMRIVSLFLVSYLLDKWSGLFSTLSSHS